MRRAGAVAAPGIRRRVPPDGQRPSVLPGVERGGRASTRSLGRSVLAVVGWLLPAKKPPGHRANVPVPLPAASGADVGAHAALARMRCGRASARRARAGRPRACLYSTERDG
jgi:hypothetical protein